MIGNRRPSESFAVVATLDPQTVANTEKVTDWVDVRQFEQVAFVALTGDMPAETIDFKLQQATDGSGTGAKDLVAATQLAAGATANDGAQLILEARTEELDTAGGFYFVRGRVITGGAVGGPMAVIGLGFNSRYGVGTDLATVAQIKQA